MKTGSCNEVAGIILAAGRGERFERNKAFAEINGVTFLERISRGLQAAGCQPIVVVSGSESERIIPACEKLKLKHVFNQAWQSGQFSSLRAGLLQLETSICGAMMALVDHPFVNAVTYCKLMEIFSNSAQNIIIPVYNGKRGHPVILPADIIDEIKLRLNEISLREIINNNKSKVVYLQCDDPGILIDIDTKNDLLRALEI